ncbi:MAG: hypothetical protein IME96_04340 [Proteobacteria bacterium]|nr:hypothetical protein [Pseudomonadota bacterium]
MFKLGLINAPTRIVSMIFLLSLLLISGCEAGPKATEQAKPNQEKKRKILKINVDMDTQAKLQKTADLGFKPWKNDAVEVAKECIIGAGIGAPDKCMILSKSEAEAVIRVTTKKEGSFDVTLKRLVKPDGIWTATKVEKKE